jgi:hypothetical protein
LASFRRLRRARLVAGVKQLSEVLQDRLDPVIGRLRAGHHHRERAVHRALDAAADRRIDQRQVPRFESLRDQFGGAGPGGGQVDQHRGAVSGNDSIGPQRDRLDDVGVGRLHSTISALEATSAGDFASRAPRATSALVASLCES